MRFALPFCLVLAACAAIPEKADAQAKNRWRINWHNDKPQIHTHRSPTGKLENYWYFTYDLVNTSDQVVPVLVEIQLYTSTGKDLQHGVKKVDMKTAKDENARPIKAEEYLFGRFYSNVIVPKHVEYEIIAKDANLRNRSQGIIEESIENFKKGDKDGTRWYLNPREMRRAAVIRAGQKLHGIAIFRGVDPRSRIVELHVSGLVDIIRIEQVAEFETKMHYENNVLRLRYEWKGDEFDVEKDWLTYMKKDWLTKKIGPVASKETLGKLVNGLLDAYKREKDWKDAGKTAEEVAALRVKHHITQLDINIMARVFRLATGKDLKYDEDKDVYANEKAVWRIHEWWVTNRSKLVFNVGLNRFVVKEDKLPGQVDVDKPKTDD